MEITDINFQPLSSLLLDFYICPSCKVIDKDENRALDGHPCSSCGKASHGARQYFSPSVIALVDLVQEYFQLSKGDQSTNKDKHRLAAVIFFCTLGEVLLENFLVECMAKQDISRQVQKRLLDDSQFAKQRIEKLFPLFTGISWKSAIENLDNQSELNYSETVSFYLDVVKKRNKILHKGNVWSISSEISRECIDKMWPLINMFVALHNEYIRTK